MKIYTDTNLFMLDGKMNQTSSGTGGGYCQYCPATKKQANGKFEIEKGFVISRDFREAKEIWEALQFGAMKYKDKERQGQTKEPLAEQDINFYGLLHSKLQVFDYPLKILYHLVAKYCKCHVMSYQSPIYSNCTCASADWFNG